MYGTTVLDLGKSVPRLHGAVTAQSAIPTDFGFRVKVNGRAWLRPSSVAQSGPWPFRRLKLEACRNLPAPGFENQRTASFCLSSWVVQLVCLPGSAKTQN
jgi:hypothetical protein